MVTLVLKALLRNRVAERTRRPRGADLIGSGLGEAEGKDEESENKLTERHAPEHSRVRDDDRCDLSYRTVDALR